MWGSLISLGRKTSLLALSSAACSLSLPHVAIAFQPAVLDIPTKRRHRMRRFPPLPATSLELSSDVDFQSLMVMDVVLFQRRQTDLTTKLELGAVQENGNVAPLSAWTLESAYTSGTDDKIEFVVDEEDMFPGFSSADIRVVKLLEMIDYGSRQVGGGKGPGNPHGEESEMLYYVDRDMLEATYEWRGDETERRITVDVVVNPNLEHLW